MYGTQYVVDDHFSKWYEYTVKCYRYEDYTTEHTLLVTDHSFQKMLKILQCPTLSASIFTTASSHIYSFALGPSIVGKSRSLISPAASLSQKLMRSLPNPLLTMLN